MKDHLKDSKDKRQDLYGWTAVAVVAALLIAHNLWLDAQRRDLLDQLTGKRAYVAQLEREAKEGSATRMQVAQLYRASQRRDKKLAEMLKGCESREDFIVREGPRIAWGRLAWKTNRLFRLGVYVPAGRHKLCCDVLPKPPPKRGYTNVSSEKNSAEKAFRRDVARAIHEAFPWQFSPEAAVYEIKFSGRSVSVVGAGSTPCYKHELDLPEGDYSIQANAAWPGVAYPSELKRNDEDRLLYMRGRLSPVVDLAEITMSKPGEWPIKLRLWIDSEAPACLPAIEVAGDYHDVTSLYLKKSGSTKRITMEDRDREFRRLFMPYDGSGCFEFR